jgi:hypothetical protein
MLSAAVTIGRVGIFSLFKSRREKESAVPASAALGSFADPEGQPVVGEQVEGGQPAELGSLGGLIQQAIAQGNVEIEQGPAQTLDLRGTGLREQIVGIMREHGIDPDSGEATNVDASNYGDMQSQILEALKQHGLDLGSGATSFNIQAEPDGD